MRIVNERVGVEGLFVGFISGLAIFVGVKLDLLYFDDIWLDFDDICCFFYFFDVIFI